MLHQALIGFSAEHRQWSQITFNFLGAQISQLVFQDHRVAAVGLTRLLIQSTLSLKELNLSPHLPCAAPTAHTDSAPLIGPGSSTSSHTGRYSANRMHVPQKPIPAQARQISISRNKLGEQAAGYQAAYLKLATPAHYIIAYAGDVHAHLAREVAQLL